MTCTTARNHSARADYAPPMRRYELEYTRAGRIADVIGTAIGLGIVVAAVIAALRYLT